MINNEEDQTYYEELFKKFNTVLKDTDVSEVTAETTAFSELKPGYYLSEVKDAKLTLSKTSGKPMVSFQLKVVEDGTNYTETGTVVKLQKTAGKMVFKHFVIADDTSVKRFAADMMKFEDKEGKPVLPKEAFTDAALLSDAISCLIGMRIYVFVSTSEKDDGTVSSWTNFISWKRAGALELPV